MKRAELQLTGFAVRGHRRDADRFAQLASSVGAQGDARLPGTRRLQLRENSAAAGTIEVDRELVKRVRDLTR